MRKYLVFLLSVVFFSNVFAQSDTKLIEGLKRVEGIQIEAIPSFDSLHQTYKIFVDQALDHLHPEGKHFVQKIYLSHINFNAPLVIVTEGYQARRNYLSEPAKILNANQIIIEHRFFGESVPDSLNWEMLNTYQAAADDHRIVEIFKKIYPQSARLSTGISKGGQTTIYYRYYYPKDVAVSMPYVAPLNIEQEDPRINLFLRTVGRANCRARILDFQRKLLAHESEILALFKRYKKQNNIEFMQSDGLVFEFSVLEFPFTFWQWAPFSCQSLDSITNSAEALFHKLQKARIISTFSKESQAYYLPFLVQAYQEIGYYNYDIDSLKSQLNFVTNPSNRVFLPDSLQLPYREHQMEKIAHWLANNGNHFLYIYGENDPWISTSPNPDSRVDALKMVATGGCHATRLKDFSSKEQQRAIDLIKSWLKEKQN
jgi:hypothetical protein